MANYCEITGKKTQVGGKYSNRVRATQFNPVGKVRRKPNLQKKTYFIPEIGKTVIITVSARGIRTINKIGIYEALKRANYKFPTAAKA